MDQPQNPLAEGKRGNTTYTTPVLATSFANLERELFGKTLLPTPDTRAAADLPKASPRLLLIRIDVALSPDPSSDAQ